MKKSYTKYFAIILMHLALVPLFSQCTIEDNNKDNETKFNSYIYHSYKKDTVLAGFGNPLGYDAGYPIAQTQDRIFVASKGVDNKAQVIVFDKETYKQVKTIRSHENVAKSGDILNIAVGKEFLYISAMEAWVHVYNLNTYEYICSFGNGNYNQSIQAMAMIEWGEFLIMREKRSAISILRLSDLRKDNMPILNWKRAYSTTYIGDCTLYAGKTYKEPTNYWDNGSNMIMETDSTILIPDKQSKFIARLLPELIKNLSGNTGTGTIRAPEKPMPTPETLNPVCVAINKDLLYCTGNGFINVYDRAKGEWQAHNIKSIAGYSFGNPYRILTDGENILWVADTDKKSIVKVLIRKNEIREY